MAMTSLLTNAGAISALSTLRSITRSADQTQAQVASGYRIGNAADNAAYWSIATTMRSDHKAISAVGDALNLADATVAIAYEGMSATIDILADFKSKLVASAEPGVDRSKIQKELDQLKDQVSAIASSASFAGQNWLSTEFPDIYDDTQAKTSLVASFTRQQSGVSLDRMDVQLSKLALFNSTGGGMLQADPRDPKTLGGIRTEYNNGNNHLVRSTSNLRAATYASFDFNFSGPLSFNAGETIAFDITVDADNPADGLPGAQNPGKTTGIVIDRALVDTVLGVGANGVISTYTDYAQVLNSVLGSSGSGARATTYRDYRNDPIIDRIGIWTQQNSGLDGSFVGVTNIASTVSSGGLGNASDFSQRGQEIALNFTPFRIFDGVEVSFNFGVNNSPTQAYTFNSDFVNTTLGKTDGGIDTSGEMETLLRALLSTDWPDVNIDATSGSTIMMETDVNADRKSGSGTYIGFTGISVNIEPIPTLNFLDIDIVANPQLIETYISYVDVVSERAIDGAALLGSLQSRIGMQSDFAERLTDSLERGIGKLVDADMNEASTRLKALQTQQQLGVQALSIANAANQNILQLLQ
ncbi:flagellin [Rhizobium sp. 0TCS1.26]